MTEQSNASVRGIRIHITGIVQGVGFRPFVYSLATRYGLMGWVRNTSAGVDIELDGPLQALQDFSRTLQQEIPPLAKIDSINIESIPPGGFTTLEIRHSEPIPGAFIPISPDVSICPDCVREMLEPTDRRYQYPFINCTNCGPRFTIIQDIPYDRPKTTMVPFQMCPDCLSEYQDPLDRRFHAQPVACPVCGPHIWLQNPTEGADYTHTIPPTGAGLDMEVIHQSQTLLSQGKILAIKGLGGFHLACDATNPDAVSELRRRKLRVDKPFALMMKDIDTVAQHCYLTLTERNLLLSRERPIVLLDRKPGSTIDPAVAPNQHTLGVMLPYTPLHYLLFEPPDPQPASTPIDEGSVRVPDALVMTSGNLSEEPIVYHNQEAFERLTALADDFLLHDRGIHTRCDDSVVREVELPLHPPRAITLLLRRSRGYAPNPINLPGEGPEVLATGSELKNTFCLTKDAYAFLSHHIGDMENYETLLAFERGIEHYQNLFRVTPQLLACDLHPDYLATRYALDRASAEGLPLYQIQHHHAHVVACMADHGLDGKQPILGVSLDGTGYGTDGAIWGGEFLIVDYHKFHRFAHLEYTPLPGGDAATRKPFRIALAQLWHHQLDWDSDLPPVIAACSNERSMLRSILENKINTPLTSSMGRLFDAVAALAGIRAEVNYEAQAAMEFEALADPNETQAYPFQLRKASPMTPDPGDAESGLIISTELLYPAILTDLRHKVPVSAISARFHNGLANIILETCQAARSTLDLYTVALSGGVWQNKTLLQKTVPLLETNGFNVYTHQQVPPNDGGLALGQAVIARHVSSS